MANHGQADLVPSVLFALDTFISTKELENIKTKVATLDNVNSDLEIDVDERIRGAVLATACRFAKKDGGCCPLVFCVGKCTCCLSSKWYAPHHVASIHSIPFDVYINERADYG